MKKSLAGLALVAAAFGAGAQTLSLVNPLAHPFDGFNAPIGTSFSSGVFATLSVSGPATVTYDFMGSESGYNTSLFASFFGGATGQVTENTGSSAVGTVNGGPLVFSFSDGTGSEIFNSQGSSFAGTDKHSFLILGSNVATSGQSSYLLGYNDSFSGDADFDDIVVRVSVSPIPEPSTYALMLAGLAAVGFVARRRRSS